MKKSNLFNIAALLAVLLVMGIGLAGCDNGSTGGGSGDGSGDGGSSTTGSYIEGVTFTFKNATADKTIKGVVIKDRSADVYLVGTKDTFEESDQSQPIAPGSEKTFGPFQFKKSSTTAYPYVWIYNSEGSLAGTANLTTVTQQRTFTLVWNGSFLTGAGE